MSRNRYLVVSDMHLCDVEEHPDGWKRYKARKFLVDDEFRDLVQEVATETAEDKSLVLVLNGDIIDFDLVTACPDDPPWPTTRRERFVGLKPTEAKSVWKLQWILGDHPVFVEALTRFVAAGHTIVYVLGNHDRELHFPKVKAAFFDAMQACANEKGLEIPDEPIHFEPWFYHVPGEIFAEHGQQYDFYCSYRYILNPVFESRAGEPTIALPMGNLSNRNLMGGMGFFNPHGTDYILGAFAYVGHWLKHYAFTRRSIIWRWLVGSLVTLFALLAVKKQLLAHPPEGYEEAIADEAERSGLSHEAMAALIELQRPPITQRVFKILREFWIDRLLLTSVLVGGTVALALTPIPLWIKLMVPLSCFPLLLFIYEQVISGDTAANVDAKIHANASKIASVVPTKLITIGHTHIPHTFPLGRGVTFANTGTWAPIWDHTGTALAPGLRNYLIVDFVGGEIFVDLDSRMPLPRFDKRRRRGVKGGAVDPEDIEKSNLRKLL